MAVTGFHYVATHAGFTARQRALTLRERLDLATIALGADIDREMLSAVHAFLRAHDLSPAAAGADFLDALVDWSRRRGRADPQGSEPESRYEYDWQKRADLA